MGILKIATNEEGKRILPKKPVQDSVNPEELFDFYDESVLPTSWEEHLWAVVSPGGGVVSVEDEVQDEAKSEEALFVEVEVNNNAAIPPGAVLLVAADNNNEDSFSYPEEATTDPNNFWGQHTFQEANLRHAPPRHVEGHVEADEKVEIFEEKSQNEAPIRDSLEAFDLFDNAIIDNMDDTEMDIYNMDIVQYAMNDALLDPQIEVKPVIDDKTMLPIATTKSFIHPLIDQNRISEQCLPDLSTEPSLPATSTTVFAKKSSPYALQSKPALKRKVGRPQRTVPRTITKVPGSCEDVEEVKGYKYRRMRDLNNLASAKCRQKRKTIQSMKEEECVELEEKNQLLMRRMQEMEQQLSLWKTRCESLGVTLVDINMYRN